MLRGNRKHERVKKDCRIIVEPFSLDESAPKGVTVSSVTEDISLDGLYFKSAIQLKEGAPVKVKVEVETTGDFSAFIEHTGIVRWVRQPSPDEPFQVGIQFRHTKPEDIKRWKDFVGAREEKFF